MRMLFHRLIASLVCMVAASLSGAASLSLLGRAPDWSTFAAKAATLFIGGIGCVLMTVAVLALLAAAGALLDPNFPQPDA